MNSQHHPHRNLFKRSNRRVKGLLCLFIALVGLSGTVAAQRLDLAGRGPFYVDDPISVQVRFTTNANAKFEAYWTPPSDSPISVVGPTQTGRELSFNGSSSSITHSLGFAVTIAEIGQHQIGPFTISLGGEEYQTNVVNVLVGEIEDDKDFILEFEADMQEAFVGQRIPCKLSWGIIGSRQDVQYAYSRLKIRADFLKQFDILAPAKGDGTPITIQAGDNRHEVEATAIQKRVAGEQVIVLQANFDVIPTQSLDLKTATLVCNTRKLISVSQRGFFSLNRDVEDAPARRTFEYGQLSIKPIPNVGRPATFRGAVGEEFAIEVATNRDTIRVGDPLTVEVKLTGDGYLDKLTLPRLDKSENFPLDQFKLPSERPAGSMSNGKRQYKLTARASSSDVTEFPAVDFSWFQPSTKTFKTTRSKPVPLTVLDAQIVSASSVVSGSGRTSLPTTDANQRAAAGAVGEIPIAANLAIAPLSDLLSAPQSWPPDWLLVACYAIPLGLLPIALAVRYFSSVDATQRKLTFSDLLRRLAASQPEAVAQRCETMTDIFSKASLRLEERGARGAEFRERIAALSARVDAIRFAPADQLETDGVLQLDHVADELKDLLLSTAKEANQ